MADWAPEAEELGDDTAGAVAIVLVTADRPGNQRTNVRGVTARFPSVPVVVIGPHSRNGAHHALEAGAAGFVLERQLESALPAAIHAVRSGLIVAPRKSGGPAVRVPLTHRERETLALLVMGLTNRQIAARLFLAESTVKTHLTSIFGKLGVGSRSEAVARALDPDERLGILGLVPESAVGTPPRSAP